MWVVAGSECGNIQGTPSCKLVCMLYRLISSGATEAMISALSMVSMLENSYTRNTFTNTLNVDNELFISNEKDKVIHDNLPRCEHIKGTTQ